MRRNISLYIGGNLVELDNEELVLFNYTQEDLDNPTIVKNSYSQQLTLKGTPRNNKVFTDSFRLDKDVKFGYNPRVKVDFAIYNEMNEILESGYAKLDNISSMRGIVEYKVSLYGGLGSFLYQLSFNEDGDKLTLADLNYLGLQNHETELDFTINGGYVKNSWDELESDRPRPKYGVLNFAPCYNGIPEGFDADKAIYDFANGFYPVTGIHKASLARKFTEREMKDMRSYLQRPILKVSAIIRGIKNFAHSKGWSFEYDASLLTDNDYLARTWMTLPIVNVANEETGMRSGETITKYDLMKGTDTPANYLLGLCKTFGLKLLCNDNDKVIRLMTRDSYFIDETLDISDRIDLSTERNIDPLVIKSKWYQMDSEDSGEFAKTYQETYGRPYGSQRINTGYEFNTETKKITEKIVFKGGVQSQETSVHYRDCFVTAVGNPDMYTIPSPFLEGGTYEYQIPGTDDVESYDLILDFFQFHWDWWQTRDYMKGYDINDFVQLHQADNKSTDGANVLIFFDRMIDAPDGFHLSDDVAELMGETPCWNLTSQNSTPLTQIPHFSRFLMVRNPMVTMSPIINSLDWGESKQLDIPYAEYDEGGIGVYHSCWKNYLTDRYDENTKVVTLKVNLHGMQVGNEMLRKFYWFDNSIWVLNKIKNYSLTTYDSVECEFIQVQDKNRYLNGQNF